MRSARGLQRRPATWRRSVNDEGGGPDGAPITPPSSPSVPRRLGLAHNLFPVFAGNCSVRLGNNVKVNQNCLNVTDPDLQGRGQANNETSIASIRSIRPHRRQRQQLHPRRRHLRGALLTERRRTWADATMPNCFTGGPPGFARQYWQAGGDTSVAWDTRGNAYLSCQLFNRGTVASPNPDQSSAFVLFRSTQNDGASWNFPGRYSTVFFDPPGTSGVLEDKALMTVDNNVQSPYRDRIYVTWTEFAADGTAYIYEVHSDDYGETFSTRVLVSADNPSLCTNTFGAGHADTALQRKPVLPAVRRSRTATCTWPRTTSTTSPHRGSDNHYQVLLAKSTDGGPAFSAPVKVSEYYDLPTATPIRAQAPIQAAHACRRKARRRCPCSARPTTRQGRSTLTIPTQVTVTFGSYINQDSNEPNGCVPAGFAPTATRPTPASRPPARATTRFC